MHPFLFQRRSTTYPRFPEENRVGEGELLLLEANWKGFALHLCSDRGSVGVQRDVTTGLVDTEAKAKAKGRAGAGSFVQAAAVSLPGRRRGNAMQEFIARGGMIGTTIGPKGVFEDDKDKSDYKKELKDKKFGQEAQKL